MLIEHLLVEQFADLRELMRACCDPYELPPIKALNHLAGQQSSGHPGIQFEAQTQSMTALEYESTIHQHRCVPTRQNNVHDLFNAGCWLNWPLSKRAINQAHLAHHHADDPAAASRSRPRDYLTFLDEVGVILLCSDSRLLKAHRSHDWKALFVDHREAWGKRVVPMILGHGLLEQCQTPYIGLTAKCLYLMVGERDIDGSWTKLLQQADRLLAARIRQDLDRLNDNKSQAASLLLPLPVLGVPGWWPANQASEFYDDDNYFRPRRQSRL